MSELKFRVWDKKNKRMIKNEDILNIDFRFREIEYLLAGETLAVTFEEAEIMQYTGLKDKNGKEIYEGDILFSDYYTEIRVVKFENGSFYAMHKNFRYELCKTNEDSVVIGNIYENRG